MRFDRDDFKELLRCALIGLGIVVFLLVSLFMVFTIFVVFTKGGCSVVWLILPFIWFFAAIVGFVWFERNN